MKTGSLISRLKDVVRNAWFYNAIRYVTERRYMTGMAEDTFAPEGLVTRAQVAQILFNMEGQPDFRQSGSFTDAAQSAWYFSPVMWAQSTGLVDGFPDGTFRPDAPITREQMATILQRYADWKGLHFDAVNRGAAGSFADFGTISGYAKAAMQRAAEAGILNGDDHGNLNPGSSATRAEIATMLMNFDASKK